VLLTYEPENYSAQQFNELDRLTERWIADHLRKAKTSKKRTRTRHSAHTGKYCRWRAAC
jgi:hypothetical protein